MTRSCCGRGLDRFKAVLNLFWQLYQVTTELVTMDKIEIGFFIVLEIVSQE